MVLIMNRPYPIYVLPPKLQNLFSEVQKETKAPVELIVLAVWSAMTLAVQNLINVSPKPGRYYPVSLYFITAADSGERKTTVDSLIMASVYRLQQELAIRYEHDFSEYEFDIDIWKTIDSALKRKLEKANNIEQMNEIKNEIKNHNGTKPEAPINIKFIHNDITSAAIKNILANQWPSIGICSNESAGILNSSFFSDVSLINTLWGGYSFSVERGTRPSITIKDPRVSISLMIQTKVLEMYLSKRSCNMIESGLFARFLYSKPISTQGTRFIECNESNEKETLEWFQKKIYDQLTESLSQKNTEKKCLTPSDQALKIWTSFYNQTEAMIAPNGELSEFKDIISKSGENTFRLSAVLQYFHDESDVISEAAMIAAVEIMKWHIDEATEILSPHKQIPVEFRDAELLEKWLVKKYNWNYKEWIKKNDILKIGPNTLRSKAKLDAAINTLYHQQKILIWKQNKTTYIKYRTTY